MPKGYWVSIYRSVSDPKAFSNYVKLALPALESFGGRFLTRGMPAAIFENAIKERLVIIEFESVQKAVDAHESPAYQAALKALGTGADREIRIMKGIDKD